MAIYLGLGANLGDRKQNLTNAIHALAQEGVNCLRCSPVVETPALLPHDAPWEWNKPYLNMAIEVSTGLNPDQLLEKYTPFRQNLNGKTKSAGHRAR